MDTAELIYKYIDTCLKWLPTEFYLIFLGLVSIRFADTLLGIVNRAWKAVGRG